MCFSGLLFGCATYIIGEIIAKSNVNIVNLMRPIQYFDFCIATLSFDILSSSLKLSGIIYCHYIPYPHIMSLYSLSLGLSQFVQLY